MRNAVISVTWYIPEPQGVTKKTEVCWPARKMRVWSSEEMPLPEREAAIVKESSGPTDRMTDQTDDRKLIAYWRMSVQTMRIDGNDWRKMVIGHEALVVVVVELSCFQAAKQNCNP
ncbi:hypothetical protein R1flu_011881 [Riccia fluitans]|uniref:Uncharacterized protein n=1 Tax=Riccia fluitans TaxID=41844 RepID=A0ABD1Z915_9MARC